MSDDRRTIVKITDAHLNDLYSNRALAEMSGYQAEELDALGWINVVDPQAQSLFEEIISTVAKMPYVRECFETNIICRDGSMRTLAWDVTSLSPDQFPLMLITARESAAKRLPGAGIVRTRQVSPIPGGMWEEIFDNLPDCVSIHDEHFTILAVNRALRERLALSPSEIVGRKCHEVFHGLGQPVEHCVLVCAMAGKPGERFNREAYERQFKGVCHIEAARFPLGKSGHRAIIHTLRTSDSYDSGPGAASRREMESLSRLANAIAHDYNNLLSGVVGYTGMLQMLGDLPEKATRYVTELQRSAARMNEMTQRLLLFGRRRVLRAQPIDLGRLIGEALRSSEVVPKDRAVHYDAPHETLMVSADPVQVQLLLAQLVRNALEATKEGGEVMVRAAQRRPSKPFPTFFAVAPAGEYGCLEVRDTGPGIDSDMLVRVFEPFMQGEGRSVARGLGLAIVYRIVHNHNGYVEAESERGVGTRITVLLPAPPQ